MHHPGDRVRYTERADPRRDPADAGTVIEPTDADLMAAARCEYPPDVLEDALVRWDYAPDSPSWEYREDLELIDP